MSFDLVVRNAVLILTFLFLLGDQVSAQAPFYQGKSIRIIVGSTTGGGYDLWARLLARYLGKHTPGNPDVVVQNMPGAGSQVAANHIYNVAKPDGLTIGSFNPAL